MASLANGQLGQFHCESMWSRLEFGAHRLAKRTFKGGRTQHAGRASLPRMHRELCPSSMHAIFL